MMKKITYFTLWTVILGLTSCSAYLDDIRPTDKIEQSQLTDADLEKLMYGTYGTMESFTYNYWFDFDKRAENFTAGPGFALTDPIDMVPNSKDVGGLWNNAMENLRDVNFLIESYEQISSPSASNKKAGTAGYFFRALIYYNMVIRWHKAPILYKRTTNIVPLSEETSIWSFIEENLTKALALVDNTTDKFQVTRSAIEVLAMRVALSQGKEGEALTYATNVLNRTGINSLANTSLTIAENFKAATGNKEVIFALANKRSAGFLKFYDKINDVDATWDYSPAKLQLFDDNTADGVTKSGDKRKSVNFNNNTTRLIKFPSSLGVFTGMTTTYDNTPICVFRLPELFFIKAEIEAKTDKAKAAATLQPYFTARYSTPPLQTAVATLTDRQFQDLLLDERHREYYGEGHWWYDVKRTNRWDLLPTLGTRVHLKKYPIPQREIDLAGKENYPQNEGY